MNLIVTPDPKDPTCGTLVCGTRDFSCVLGRGGVSTHKQEGDGATPAGTFPLRRLFYRADRLAAPATALPVAAIGRDDGWCDAPGAASYNRLVTLPIADSAENLWRDDHVYDLVVVIGYNDAPAVAGKGSAIFMHITTPEKSPTAGCVALTQPDLLAVLTQLDAGSTITIHA